MSGETFVDVAVALPSVGALQYSVPVEWNEKVGVGKLVHVKIKNRLLVGTVLAQSGEATVRNARAIEDVIDHDSVLDAPLLELAHWMSQNTLCSIGQAVAAILPAPFRKGKLFMKSRARKMTDGISRHDPGFSLTPDQEKAVKEIRRVLDEKRHESFLLHGITGSGKTEVYMRLIGELIAQSRGSIVLVPEISLTPQTVERFYSRFGDCLAVIHSRLTQAQRVEEWHRIQKGAAKVIVGARSAIFSPVRNLGLIVIDEEHDTSYKQEESPRYLARTVAEKRCQIENAVLVMGSATPSLEIYHRSKEGTVKYLELGERIEKRPLPAVEIVDMRREPRTKFERIFSGVLERALRECLEKKEQAMLLLNRRGFSTYHHCASCGWVATCKYCRISLTYHFDKRTLLCHTCHFRAAPEKLCPGCRKNYLHYFGTGTQKVESEAERLFPGARIARMDSDSTARKDAHEHILSAFRKREIDILIGTQMIAKGHDFPYVSLIGAVSADTALHIADFRSAERTFDLLTQVAGRAGRGDIAGRVLVQTTVPHHYAIQSAKDHDYREFYEKEIQFRKELRMPPYSELVRILTSGREERQLVRESILLARHLEAELSGRHCEILGPAPCLISKERGLYRWNLLIKTPGVAQTNPILREALHRFKSSGIFIVVDVDPQ